MAKLASALSPKGPSVVAEHLFPFIPFSWGASFMSTSLRRKLPVTVLAIAGLLGTLLVGTASAAPTTVTGTVKTSTGVDVAGVRVAIKVGAGRAKIATTNANGQFSVNTRTGSGTIRLTNTTVNAALPQVWDIRGIATNITSNAVLNFTLPATSVVDVKVTRAGAAGAPIADAAIGQYDPAASQANSAVVLPGTAAVAPTQDFTGARTNATGDVSLRAFKDSTLGRLAARFTTTDLGATTTYAARSGIKDASVDVLFPIKVANVVEQAGNVLDSTGGGQANLEVAIRSASGQIDSSSPLTTAGGAFTTQVAPGDVFARISGSSLSSTVAPPPNIPRAFKATFDASATGTPWTVDLPATVTLTVKVENADGSPVSGAVIRPAVGSSFGEANSATLLAGGTPATLTQQVYGDGKSDAAGLTSARLFPDSNLAAFRVLKNVGGGNTRVVTVAAGTVLTSATQITVTLPPAA